jgi:integrase
MKVKTKKAMALKNQKTKSDYLDWEIMQNLVLKLERDNELKFCLLISTGSYFGLRISDLLNIRWNQVIQKDKLTIIEKKTGKERTITIHDELKEILVRLYSKIKPKSDEDFLFVNRFGNKPISVQYVNEKLKSIFKHYKIDGQYSSHFMRKTLGRIIWKRNNYSEQSLILLSQLFNHSSLSTTKIYLGIKDQEISDLYLSI